MENTEADVRPSVKVPVPAPTTPAQPEALQGMAAQALVSPGLPTTPISAGGALPKWPEGITETHGKLEVSMLQTLCASTPQPVHPGVESSYNESPQNVRGAQRSVPLTSADAEPWAGTPFHPLRAAADWKSSPANPTPSPFQVPFQA